MTTHESACLTAMAKAQRDKRMAGKRKVSK